METHLEPQYHTITITISNRELSYKQVSDLLHSFGEKILLRVGYPVADTNTGVIFIIAKLTNDELGSFSGRLGQLKSVKVKSMTLKI